jgi:hypothetical protein
VWFAGYPEAPDTKETNMTTEIERKPTEDTPTEESDARLSRFEKRFDEWLSFVRDEASVRSPEVLTAMATKVHGLGNYLDKMADQARVRREAQETYSGPTPDLDPKSTAKDTDQER